MGPATTAAPSLLHEADVAMHAAKRHPTRSWQLATGNWPMIWALGSR
jgi:hypothetical protein